jgi:small subunit ribosomal protein S17
MRKLKGTIVSDKMQKTRVVSVTRLVRHARYNKFYKVTNRFKAHDEKNEYKLGETVVIQEIRPMSKDKRWTITERIQIKK